MITLLVLTGCVPEPFDPHTDERVKMLAFYPDAPLPPAIDDFGNDYTGLVDDPQVAALGQQLYADATLSADGSASCLTCHELCLEPECEGPFDGDPTKPGHGVELSAADPGVAFSMGVSGLTTRNSPTLRETARRTRWGWGARFCDLDDQSLLPIDNGDAISIYGHSDGMAVNAVAAAVRDAYAPEDWPAALGPLSATDEPCEMDEDCDADEKDILTDVGHALEAYLRTLARDWPTRTALDRAIDGEEDALDASELRGLALFVGKAHCIDCHVGPLLSDDRIHGTSVPGDDLGVAKVGVDEDCVAPAEGPREGAFLTPPIRNVALTPPYMHDGSLETLDDVVWHYNEGGVLPPEVVGIPDPRFEPLSLDPGESGDLKAFLLTLGPS